MKSQALDITKSQTWLLALNNYSNALKFYGKFSMKDKQLVIEQLIQVQTDLFAYILSLCGNYNDAKDILQESNLVIMKKSSKRTPLAPQAKKKLPSAAGDTFFFT